MSLSSLCRILTAAAAITSVQASPFFDFEARSPSALQTRDLSGSSCVPFVYGSKDTPLSTVCVSISGGTLTVTYPTLPSGGTYTDLHVDVETSPIKEDNQGKWPYTLGNNACKITGGGTQAICTITVLGAWRVCNSPLYIGVHASFNLPDGSSNTGWGQGTCISTRPNCPKYFTFTTTCTCPVVTTYEPYTTSLVYVKTILETHTTTCSTVAPPVTKSDTCTNPNAGATQTVDGGATPVAGFTCTTPA
ncbi:hypothetical protein GQ44DRAFT_828487 [Phaeosphaeriaceae sp. PMI808]|nr:hypothetical protein GQ44DRAFT_828487 [Phaeosphaeriaceae sp. PMI808]